ncbi:aspartate carbamoyltransferase [secondary endosymbiont of Ctenarytaina eucalypti]|uniref:Aspartate carbamoyltransferase n=2 Tax=secondary endosymbiont of Ctenarytaina eucalypti TaxID=1199245 RepID=J3TXJ0_9ENTR|nr:aspartate carbamoyltransferase [secondary endosymbiont of Ctenarytaina eucalypti]
MRSIRTLADNIQQLHFTREAKQSSPACVLYYFYYSSSMRGFFLGETRRVVLHLMARPALKEERKMVNPLYQKHIISINDLSRGELEMLLSTAGALKAQPQPALLRNKVIASCFFEASTRTRLSFETAIHRLGASVVGFPDADNTSLSKKGETLADTISVISTYVDAIVMRYPKEGGARLASEFSGQVPILNAGDGANQHPTQTLLDLFTIQETQGRLDHLSIAMVGDLKYGRTVHSLTQALAKFDGNHFYFIAPQVLGMPRHILNMLEDSGIAYSLRMSIEEVVPALDVLYMTRVQKERLDPSEYANVKAHFVLNAADLLQARTNLKILHPLPRVDEIAIDVDHTPYAYYFQQAGNGIFARQALLSAVLGHHSH